MQPVTERVQSETYMNTSERETTMPPNSVVPGSHFNTNSQVNKCLVESCVVKDRKRVFRHRCDNRNGELCQDIIISTHQSFR